MSGVERQPDLPPEYLIGLGGLTCQNHPDSSGDASSR
jgi:hypothetical protein